MRKRMAEFELYVEAAQSSAKLPIDSSHRLDCLRRQAVGNRVMVPAIEIHQKRIDAESSAEMHEPQYEVEVL